MIIIEAHFCHKKIYALIYHNYDVLSHIFEMKSQNDDIPSRKYEMKSQHYNLKCEI